jgi:hypothetical protein
MNLISKTSTKLSWIFIVTTWIVIGYLHSPLSTWIENTKLGAASMIVSITILGVNLAVLIAQMIIIVVNAIRERTKRNEENRV